VSICPTLEVDVAVTVSGVTFCVSVKLVVSGAIVQFTCALTSIGPLEVVVVAKAWKVVVPPFAFRLRVVGLMVSPVTFVRDTVMLAVPLIVPDWAVIVAVPAATPVTLPELLIVATLLSELVQTTPVVRVFVLLSLYVPVAVICCVEPTGTLILVGPTVTVVSVGFTKNPRQPRVTAKIASTAKAPARRSFCLVDDMVVVAPWGACLLNTRSADKLPAALQRDACQKL
jgi:hypothetical protein